MKKSLVTVLTLLLSVVVAFTPMACTSSDPPSNTATDPTSLSAEANGSGNEIVLTYATYRVGTHVSAQSERILIDGFNREYAGRIRLEVEELPGDQAYVEKMRVLAASNALPDIVEGKDGVRELAISNGQAIDLFGYLNADSGFKAEIGEAAIQANTVDGKLYSISNGNMLISYFYNKEHFKAAGITPATTWDGFMDNLAALKSSGFIPIVMMTGENCWTTNLLLASMVGTLSDSGNSFMRTMYPESYETPELRTAMGMIQTILAEYTTNDALGAGIDVVASHFLQGNASIICNGPYMAGDFSNPEKAIPGLDIGTAMYPNDGMFTQFEIGYMICAEGTEKQDAAFEFIKYKTNANAQKIMLEENNIIPLTGDVELSAEYVNRNPLVAEVVALSGKTAYSYYTFDRIASYGVVDEMSRNYPLLAKGEVSVDDMLKSMTAAAARNR